MRLLQMPGGPELVVIGLMFVVPLVILLLVGYLFYRVANSPPVSGNEERAGDEPDSIDEQDGLSPGIRRLVDWVTVFALVLLGTVALTAGAFVRVLADREDIATLVEEEVIHSDILEEDALVDAAYTLAVWGGYALVATGLVVILGGIALAVARIRADQRATEGGDARPSLAANALVGGVVTVVTSFVPFSGVIGGAAAGYLQYDDEWAGFRAGILAGLVVCVPLSILLGVTAIGLFQAGLVIVGLGVVASLLFSLIFVIGLSAIGGYIGGYFVGRERPKEGSDRWRRDSRRREPAGGRSDRQQVEGGPDRQRASDTATPPRGDPDRSPDRRRDRQRDPQSEGPTDPEAGGRSEPTSEAEPVRESDEDSATDTAQQADDGNATEGPSS